MLQAKADQENLGIKFEFTAPGTQQQILWLKENANDNGKRKSYDESCRV